MEKSDIPDNKINDLGIILRKAKLFLINVKHGDLTFKKADDRLVFSEMTEKEKH